MPQFVQMIFLDILRDRKLKKRVFVDCFAKKQAYLITNDNISKSEAKV